MNVFDPRSQNGTQDLPDTKQACSLCYDVQFLPHMKRYGARWSRDPAVLLTVKLLNNLCACII
jgi:hypothetical protein